MKINFSQFSYRVEDFTVAYVSMQQALKHKKPHDIMTCITKVGFFTINEKI